MRGSYFSYGLQYHSGKSFLVIVDDFDLHEDAISVTNDIEGVLYSIKNSAFPEGNYPDFVVYRDTNDIWDEVIVNENFEFADFSIRSCLSEEQIISAVIGDNSQ